MLTAIVEVVWTTTSALGALVLAYLAREAYRDHAEAKRQGRRRLVLLTRIPYRMMLAWTLALIMFSLAGVGALIRPNQQPDTVLVGLIQLALVVAVLVVVGVSASAWRDLQVLYGLIELNIRQQRRRR